jgi:hypothetical protein
MATTTSNPRRAPVTDATTAAGTASRQLSTRSMISVVVTLRVGSSIQSEVDDTSILRTRFPIATLLSLSAGPSAYGPAQRAGAQRLRAMRRSTREPVGTTGGFAREWPQCGHSRGMDCFTAK